ncbi:transmembrane protein 26-like isoform X3 [Ruditapes philippinarum]|uniref:transmembrane protein 26-like isoform X1 n=1 Tax=Ruditapes philippinarum TaxID=129788 RepID=UPI00295BA1C5|nr:transmembrane protein 26-like isoform X1 [Ruditapes philippinarum]XP_060568430.1 transmembrane protein 26-like isoform X3 [Ruditapes philippinarum]
MGLVTYIRALLVRILFACHGVMAIWRLYMVTGSVWCWYLGGALFLLFLETLITIAKKRGKEWKWFCPSVFFYLGSVVPAIWFLELHEMEARISLREQAETNSTNVTISRARGNDTKESLNLNLDDFGLSISIPIAFSADLWLRVLEQFLLLMLIVGRWILPKGSISHDQLSQLLLVYVGTAADIVEFYEAFSEDEVKYNRLLCYIILGIWSLSLLQFTMVLTASKARRDQVGLPMQRTEFEDDGGCCNPELYGILTSILLQDLPFLCVRLMLIFWYHVVSYTNMFFTSKNSLVIILLIYRLIVVHTEARKKRRKQRESVISLPLYDLHSNGQKPNGKHVGKQLRKNDRSRSTPSVYHQGSDSSLPRHMKKKGLHQSKNSQSVSSLAIPTISSETNMKCLGKDRRKSLTPTEKNKI